MNRAQRLVFLLYKQGALSGSLNRVQQLALTGAIAAEDERHDEENTELIKAVILAGNLDLFRAMFPEPDDEGELDEGAINWIQPGTPEYDELMVELQATHRGMETTKHSSD